MTETGLKAGDIFIWRNYPLYMDEFKNRRWLLYLGNQTIEAIVYQITATTQFRHYETGGNRAKNNFFKIPAGVGGLERDSILDLTAFFEKIPEKLLNDCKSDIEKKGAFDQDYINLLVKHIRKDRDIIQIIKRDIYGYLRAANFRVNA
jgi:hypothetical protein